MLLCVRYNESQNNTENRNLTLLGSKNNIILDLLQGSVQKNLSPKHLIKIYREKE